MRIRVYILLCCAIALMGSLSVTADATRETPRVIAATAAGGPSTNHSAHIEVALEAVATADAAAKVQWYAEVARQAEEQAAVRRPRTLSTTPPAPADILPVGDIEVMIYAVFGDSGARAVHIARCESGLDPTAHNPSGASGLFQIMLPMHGDMFAAHHDTEGPEKDVPWDWHTSWSNAYRNAIVAYDLSSGGSDWSAWVCR